jgi:hypothetical protein
VLERGLAAERDDRFGSMTELLAQIELARTGWFSRLVSALRADKP